MTEKLSKVEVRQGDKKLANMRVLIASSVLLASIMIATMIYAVF